MDKFTTADLMGELEQRAAEGNSDFGQDMDDWFEYFWDHVNVLRMSINT